MKIALAQIEVIPGQPDRNTRRILQMVKDAKEQEADIVIFPEMAVPGYFLGDTWEQNAFLKECEECGREIIAASEEIVILFGNVAVDREKKNNDGRVRKYNAFFAAQKGKLIYPDNMPYPFVIKTLMPNYREFDDTRHFFSLQKLARELGTTPAKLISPFSMKIKGQRVRIGALLCEDGWSDNYELTPMSMLKSGGHIDFFVNISSSPYTLGKNERRHKVFSREAAEAGAPLFYVNNTGIQNNGKTVYTFDGSSTVYGAKGDILSCCGEYREELSVIDFEHIESLPPVEVAPQEPTAEICRALLYGIDRFLKSIDLQKVVVGVSGGIDSAVTAALYTKVVGADNVLLINMPSRFNSDTTKNFAKELAENLGCRYMIIPIQDAVDLTINQFETIPVKFLAEGREENFAVSSFAAENIQARDRGARVLAAAAAIFGGGFSCNANKAETTVGYCTLYGDNAGFLAAIADLWKHQVYDIAKYLNTEVFDREVIPQGIIDIVPSAELSAAQNVDEGKGDPLKYPYHDYLFAAFVERWQKATPEDILTWYAAGTLEEELHCAPGTTKKYFADAKEFMADLERWWNQFCGIGVAKRIQSPPVLAVSRRAYGFDHREAQNGAYYTREYKRLKEELLKDL